MKFTLLASPVPGCIGLVKLPDWAGPVIRVAQWLDGDGYEDFEHAVIATDEDGQCVGAMPTGAVFQRWTDTDVEWWLPVGMTDAQRGLVVEAAVRYLNTPYSFLDYLAIALHRLHLPAPKGYIASTKHMICSQLADQCYRDAGIQLFSDGRWPGFVTPGALYRLFKENQE